MQPTAAMKRLAHQSLAATFWRSISDLGFNALFEITGAAVVELSRM
jgi:hypothetical protein